MYAYFCSSTIILLTLTSILNSIGVQALVPEGVQKMSEKQLHQLAEEIEFEIAEEAVDPKRLMGMVKEQRQLVDERRARQTHNREMRR